MSSPSLSPQPRLTDEDLDPNKLRELAQWHREQAERAGSPHIWDARLRTAEDFEAAAEQLEQSRKPRLVYTAPMRDGEADARLTPRSTPLQPAA